METFNAVIQCLMLLVTAAMAVATYKMVKVTKKTLEVMQADYAAERLPRIAFSGTLALDAKGGFVNAVNFSKKKVWILSHAGLAVYEEPGSWRLVDSSEADTGNSKKWIALEPGDAREISVKFPKLNDLRTQGKRLAVSFVVFYPDYPCGLLECFAMLGEDLSIERVVCSRFRWDDTIPVVSIRLAEIPKKCV